ncbi:phosphogluconate dehydrogenase [Grosmannia clavigera kw1407]|uniref:Phosphogluconate dehydrogenase n=1 Tax=Grosmannia clavigera (strain kw1407 / UAMH 11150) TaxID=655863 RepID=F0XPC8_GROCL|nr:phosphogluconate dehydrogenase [Grosmannia clavigera kw1407]EFX00720.1 phosphogluconate dehydrogenase [Grosmannia clavigera kw1407]
MSLSDVAFIGLGAMGFGMATNLLRHGYSVTGFDACPPTLARFAAAGGKTAATPAAAVAGCAVCVCMVATAAQVQAVLVDGPDAAMPALPRQATVLVCSTVPCGYIQALARQLQSCRPDVVLYDAPVSGGAVRAAEGTLTIMGAHTTDPSAAAPGLAVLQTLAHDDCLYLILAASEAVGLAVGLAVPLDQTLLDGLDASAGASWMLANRGPRMLVGFQPVASALDIIVKDTAIITSEARRVDFPALLTSVAESSYLDAVARGWGRDDDSGLLRLYSADPSPGAVSAEEAIAAVETIVPSHLVVSLLKGIHLVAAAESLALAAHLGLDLDAVLALCCDAAGGSAMLTAHGPAIISAIRRTPLDALTPDIDTLDSVFRGLAAAVHAAQLLKLPVRLGTQALNILALARRQIGTSCSVVPAGAVVRVWQMD